MGQSQIFPHPTASADEVWPFGEICQRPPQGTGVICFAPPLDAGSGMPHGTAATTEYDWVDWDVAFQVRGTTRMLVGLMFGDARTDAVKASKSIGQAARCITSFSVFGGDDWIASSKRPWQKWTGAKTNGGNGRTGFRVQHKGFED